MKGIAVSTLTIVRSRNSKMIWNNNIEKTHLRLVELSWTVSTAQWVVFLIDTQAGTARVPLYLVIHVNWILRLYSRKPWTRDAKGPVQDRPAGWAWVEPRTQSARFLLLCFPTAGILYMFSDYMEHTLRKFWNFNVAKVTIMGFLQIRKFYKYLKWRFGPGLIKNIYISLLPIGSSRWHWCLELFEKLQFFP